MKAMTYDKIEHVGDWQCQSGAKYAIDWDRNEEKYKCPIRHYIRVYQGGRIELCTSGYRDPDLRKELWKKFEIDLQVVSQITNTEFFLPDGTPVYKNYIKEDNLLLDHEFGVALCGSKYHWVDHGYPPKSDNVVICRTRNKLKEEEFMDMWKDTLDVALTLFSISKEPVKGYSARGQVYAWLSDPSVLIPGTNSSVLTALGFMQARMPTAFNRLFSKSCEDVNKAPYLKFKLKGD